MSSAPPTSTDAPLTGAALKAQKKAEKAAKRAAIISQRPGGGQGPPQAGGQAQVPVGKGKKDGPEATPKKGAQGHKRVGSNVRDVKVLQDQSKRKVAVSEPAKPKAEDKTVELLRHLYRKRATTVAGWKDIHPAVQHLGQQMRTYVVCGSTARLVAMMQCWQRVIDDYQTPPGATFQRHFIAHVLSPHIEYLIACRPMSISMGNAIRWLKLQITKIDPDEDDSDAKMILNEAIDDFLRERVIAAANEISEIALNTFEANDTILVYGKSFVVTKSLVEAHRNGKKFNVIVVDSRPLFEGKAMAQTLTSEGIEVKYTLINGLGHAMKRATKVFLGAHALMSNGVLYSRVGTAQVAMEANDNNVPVIVLSEIVKCTDKVTLDSILFNEVADADELQLPGWRDVKGLQVLNIMHDATPAEYITNIITEAGIVPTSSIAVLHRWQHDRDERKDEKDEDDD